MFKFKIDNVNNRIGHKIIKRYQVVVNQLMKKINLGLLDGSDMMG
jgi:hypothetical protein